MGAGKPLRRTGGVHPRHGGGAGAVPAVAGGAAGYAGEAASGGGGRGVDLSGGVLRAEEPRHAAARHGTAAAKRKAAFAGAGRAAGAIRRAGEGAGLAGGGCLRWSGAGDTLRRRGGVAAAGKENDRAGEFPRRRDAAAADGAGAV